MVSRTTTKMSGLVLAATLVLGAVAACDRDGADAGTAKGSGGAKGAGAAKDAGGQAEAVLDVIDVRDLRSHQDAEAASAALARAHAMKRHAFAVASAGKGRADVLRRWVTKEGDAVSQRLTVVDGVATVTRDFSEERTGPGGPRTVQTFKVTLLQFESGESAPGGAEGRIKYRREDDGSLSYF